MRIIFLFLALAFAAGGIVFGALNASSVRLDFYWFAFDAWLGAALLLAALFGALLGGAAVLAGVAWPLRRRLRREQRQASARAQPIAEPPSPDVPLLGTERA
jgi:lipopolysaccharide assembly protein A